MLVEWVVLRVTRRTKRGLTLEHNRGKVGTLQSLGITIAEDRAVPTLDAATTVAATAVGGAFGWQVGWQIPRSREARADAANFFRASVLVCESPAYQASGASGGGLAVVDEDLAGDQGGKEADRPLRQARCAAGQVVDELGHGGCDGLRVEHVEVGHEAFAHETPVARSRRRVRVPASACAPPPRG